MKVSNAYSQISDYEKGKVKVVGREEKGGKGKEKGGGKRRW